MSAPARLTPMLRQYLEIKAEHPDAILLYRMGDFYEMFFDDAVRAAPILEVQLTARNKGSDNEAPMCGVPYHAIDAYLGKLLAAGLRVAVCDQVEDAAEAKGLVRREVTRVVTPGTVSEPGLLDGKEDNLLAGVVWDGAAGAGAFLTKREKNPSIVVKAVSQHAMPTCCRACVTASVGGISAAWAVRNALIR
jgi:DNA mismatch repair protein MutS